MRWAGCQGCCTGPAAVHHGRLGQEPPPAQHGTHPAGVPASITAGGAGRQGDLDPEGRRPPRAASSGLRADCRRRAVHDGRPFRPLTAADDQGRQLPGRLPRLACSGRASAACGPAARDRLARPHHGPRRAPYPIDLDPHGPAPDVTVTRKATSPGELLLDVIAARILTSATAFPQDNPEQLANAKAELRVFAAGPGDIIAALLAAARCPGQLAGLGASGGISGHGIAAPPAADLTEPWHSMLARYHRRNPQTALGARHPGGHGGRAARAGRCQACHPGPAPRRARHILHMLASGITLEDDWAYARGVRPCRCCGQETAAAAGRPRVPTACALRGATGWSCCGWRSFPRWTAAPPGPTSSPPGDRPRSAASRERDR
jgi:hypothetical protein